MLYQIKQKIFSLKQDFTIKNKYDEDAFIVEGKFLSIGHKLKIFDKDRNELLHIDQKVIAFLPEYYIYDNTNTEVAKVKKKLSFFKPQFIIESKFGTYELTGSVFEHNFQILKNGSTVAEISKTWFSLSDTYGAEIADGERPEFILALIIVLDMVLDDEQAAK